MVWTRDTFGWSCKNSSPGDRVGKKEEGRGEEEMERHQGVDKENIRGDPDLGARPRQVEGFGPQLISEPTELLDDMLRSSKVEIDSRPHHRLEVQ
ncbi:hypothetical protein Pcinc_010953 [Petrolisthes cinctipes]|uniref:Uncharacterized protein n=1 Tax=Petrolisthes cinctipes TaxID=88211 RepID=A0AAE1KUW6_PETCI|nr:hypothetical protein Pcinc_010953 [Petrolisthes cinctipes]